jgi:MinD-like ATPase involved in chromosome partitioning or flagellar assembly
MTRPSVLLALDGWSSSYEDAITAGGFEAIAVDRQEALGWLADKGTLDLAVIDCDRGQPGDEELFAFLHSTLRVPTIVLFSDDIPDWAVDANPGASRDEYARKPMSPEALVYRLQAMLIHSGREVPGGLPTTAADGTEIETIGEGSVITLFAPKGGVGKTMIAVNLAVAIRQQTGDSVCLIDADVGVGNVTAVFNAPYHGGLAGLADSPPEEWSNDAFEQTVTTHEASGVRVLTWGTEPSESERISTDLLVAAVRWARTHHSWVIIDSHPSYDDRTMAMLAASREIFLVVTPEVGPLRNAAQFLALAREVGLGDMVKVIVNRSNHGIAVTDIAKTLGTRVVATVVSNGPKAIMASNEGTPIILKFPKEQISTDLYNVARLLTRPQAEEAPARRRSWWSALVSPSTATEKVSGR